MGSPFANYNRRKQKSQSQFLFKFAFTLQEKDILHKVITEDEKWITYSHKRRKSCLDPGQPSPSFPNPNIHDKKVLLCVWWDWKEIIHYEPLESGQTVTGERYEAQLNKLVDVLKEKMPIYTQQNQPWRLSSNWSGRFFRMRRILLIWPR